VTRALSYKHHHVQEQNSYPLQSINYETYNLPVESKMPRRQKYHPKKSRTKYSSFGGVTYDGDTDGDVAFGKGCSLQVIYNQTIELVLTSERQNRAIAWSQDQQQQQPSNRRRPFSLKTQLSQLKGLLRERQSYEAYQLMERRRRDGFLPSRLTWLNQPEKYEPILTHPAGWLIHHTGQDPQNDKNNEEQSESTDSATNTMVPTLQYLSLQVLAQYFDEYWQAMGHDSLHAIMSILPSNSLTELSILLSSSNSGGINDHIAVLLGKHAHVDRLCFRASPVNEEQHQQQQKYENEGTGEDSVSTKLSRFTLTDCGLLELISKLTPSEESHKIYLDDDAVVETWEEWGDSDDDDNNDYRATFFPPYNDGLNIKLRRLELLDCQYVSAPVLLQLLERCSGITHLSLAGSFLRSPQDGMDVLPKLPRVLPNLQVLDVTRCPWITTSLLTNMRCHFELQRGEGNGGSGGLPPPKVYSQGYLYHEPDGTAPESLDLWDTIHFE
jgi:hypothetical protein